MFQIIPLLDILFAILIFFVLTATFVSQPGITVELPASNFSVEPALHTQIISIVGNNIFFRDQLVSDAQLGILLNNKKDTPSSTIIVKADRTVPYNRVMTVTNLALERGYRVVMAAGMKKPATH